MGLAKAANWQKLSRLFFRYRKDKVRKSYGKAVAFSEGTEQNPFLQIFTKTTPNRQFRKRNEAFLIVR
jgi:hypothetical protein